MARELSMALCVLLLFSLAPARSDPPAPGAVGTRVGVFSLEDTTARTWSLEDHAAARAIVVVFLGTECPVNNAYLPTLNELHKQFRDRGIVVVGVNSNVQDGKDRVAEHARRNSLAFPVLKDVGHRVADQFGARRTPEAFLLDSGRTIRYRGCIDNQFEVGVHRPRPTRRHLVEAIEAVLAGGPVPLVETKVASCLIGRAVRPRDRADVTYCREVSRLIQTHCQECHRPGEAAPFALMTYEDAAAWAATIREVIRDGRMPPWHADPHVGSFGNDRRLPPADRDTFLSWIDQGCPRGDDADLPPTKTWTDGWNIGEPDAVFAMPTEFKVPASTAGGIRYQYFVVDTNLAEDTWVSAAEVRPGDRSVVHHVLVRVMPSGSEAGSDPDGLGSRLLATYSLGQGPLRLPEGMAKKVPKGARLEFQIHYTPGGRETSDRTSVGLIFAKHPPKHEVFIRAILRSDFAILPGSANHPVTAASKFDHDAIVLGLRVHMHLRGKSFCMAAAFPDGSGETLLSVPRFDFNWQYYYEPATPLRLPKGTKVTCAAVYDNSPDNPNNPDPSATVRWGQQTWDEMLVGFVLYYEADGRSER